VVGDEKGGALDGRGHGGGKSKQGAGERLVEQVNYDSNKLRINRHFY